MLMLVFSFLLKGAPACEGMRSLYLYNACHTPIAKANGILGYKRTEPPVLQSLESPALSNSEMPFRGRKTGQI